MAEMLKVFNEQEIKVNREAYTAYRSSLAARYREAPGLNKADFTIICLTVHPFNNQ